MQPSSKACKPHSGQAGLQLPSPDRGLGLVRNANLAQDDPHDSGAGGRAARGWRRVMAALRLLRDAPEADVRLLAIFGLENDLER